ncbi:MAG: pyruvate dehydrogenase, partial [Sphingobacteriales bacterium]
MAEAIRMPLLSDTMKEGVIAAWHKKVGDKVKSDDVIADVETDKATMEVMPYVDGTLLYIGVETGKAAKVNEIIAIIGKEGEDYKSLLQEEPASEKTEDKPKEAAPAESTGSKETSKQEPAASNKPKAAPVPTDATVVRMPLLSDTMKEGKIVAWHKKVGDKVKSDDVLADVETDKATMEVMPYADGTLLYVGVKEGEAAKINDIIAIVGKEGTDISGLLDNDLHTQNAEAEGQPKASDQAGIHAPAVASETKNESKGDSTDGVEDGRIKASPLARKIAREKGINLVQLQGSGDGGRIIKRDIENYQPVSQEKAAPAASSTAKGFVPAAVTTGEEGYTDTPVSQMRSVIARRLAESKFSAPHFYLRMTIIMDQAMAARKRINEISPVKVSFNDLVIKASAMALRQHPDVNSSWMGD